ncbi:hypothetical protein, partial [Porphyromonas loveana]|uniref:hypothetical protein n=1 Tax=Porphyromonas loveana TaxID=1884669 RepID=UPI00359FA24B
FVLGRKLINTECKIGAILNKGSLRSRSVGKKTIDDVDWMVPNRVFDIKMMLFIIIGCNLYKHRF